ncbi:MAG: hypothetical protein J7647_30925 [Cyanobacteria bacterium SBLK]|nr:hypothetical protein [Cyanobacteria bacterium SBLK]
MKTQESKRPKLPQVAVYAYLHHELKQVAAQQKQTMTEMASEGIELILEKYRQTV